MRVRVVLGAFAIGNLVAAAAAAPAEVETRVIAQLASPLKVSKLVAVYGPAGARYPASFYADVNAAGEEKLWLFGVFENVGDDIITSFTFDVMVWDAAQNELFAGDGVFDFPLRGDAKGKEWSWDFEGDAAAATVILIPRVISLPAGRTWEADVGFIKLKVDELRAGD